MRARGQRGDSERGKHEDLNLNPQHSCSVPAMTACAYNLYTRGQRQMYPKSLLVSQVSRNGKILVQWETLSQGCSIHSNIGEYLTTCLGFHMCASGCECPHSHIHGTHVHTHRCTTHTLRERERKTHTDTDTEREKHTHTHVHTHTYLSSIFLICQPSILVFVCGGEDESLCIQEFCDTCGKQETILRSQFSVLVFLTGVPKSLHDHAVNVFICWDISLAMECWESAWAFLHSAMWPHPVFIWVLGTLVQITLLWW